MVRKVLLALFLVSLLVPSLWADAPVINNWDGIKTKEVRAMDVAILSVSASDPDGDPLSYHWVIENDPTGAAIFKEGNSTFVAYFGINSLNVTLGTVVRVRVDVSDGTTTVQRWVDVTVSGFNQAPVLTVDTSGFGTPESPRPAGGGLSLNAQASYDPDYPEAGTSSMTFFWRIKSFPQTCGGVPILIGYYGDFPGLVIPELPSTTAASTTWEVTVIDGLHLIQQQYTGYVYDPNGCAPPPPPGGSAPIVSLMASPGHAAYGQTVILTALVTNPDQGDTFSYSWKQLGVTSSQNNVNLPNVNSSTNSFTAPGVATILTFEVSVTDAQGTGKATVSVQVSENGGTGGGSSGTATGTVQGCTTGNVPAQGTLPAKVTTSKGQTVTINAVNVTDPDNTAGVVGGQVVYGALVTWSVADGKGLLTDANLNKQGNSVSFVAPNVTTLTTFVIRATVDDPLSCGHYYDVAVEVSPTSTGGNSNPVVVLKYQLPGGNPVVAGSSAVQVPVPVEIQLNASESSDPDGDDLTFSWQALVGDFQGGGYTLTSGTTSRTLKIFDGSSGSITVKLTVSDGNGGQAIQSAVFEIDESLAAPVAVVEVLMDNSPLGNRVVENGNSLVLDPGETYVPGGTGSEVLTYYWEQISGPIVFSKGFYVPIETSDPSQAVASVRIDEVEEETNLEFKLTVQNGVLEDTLTVVVPARPGSAEEGSNDLYFAQVGFGPLGGLQFRTALVLDNVSSEETDDLSVEFFDQSGQPIDLRYVGSEGLPEAWSNDEQIPANSSRVFELLEPEGEEGLTVGWAHVYSSHRLRGSVRYQVVDTDTGDFVSDVGIFSSPRGRKFQIAFRKKDHLAFAVANPADVDSSLKISILDQSRNVVAKHLQGVDPHKHAAMFLEDILDSGDLTEGTLIIEALEGEVVPTVLITRNRVAISSQTFSKIQ